MNKSESSLPPGFRFHPTDEELILHYLMKRANSSPLPVSIVAEVDIYKFDPWDLPAKAAFGEKEWYFFSPRDRKYPNGARPNRAAASGYWKATGTDKTIVTSSGPHHQHNVTIGVKKALVFYKGRPPKGVKTSWIMHEYRLSDSNLPKPNIIKDSSMRLDDWVLCRIYKKTNAAVHAQPCDEDEQDQHLLPQKSSSFSNLLDAVDYSMLTSLLSDCPTTTSTTLTASTGFEYDQAPGSGGCLDQPYFNGYPTNSNSYVTQKPPQMQLSSNKRQLPSHEDELLCPSKRYLTSCSTFMQSNVPLQTQNINVHMNPMFLDHQFFLSPEL